MIERRIQLALLLASDTISVIYRRDDKSDAMVIPKAQVKTGMALFCQ